MELRRGLIALAAVAAGLAAWPAPAGAADLKSPTSQTDPPRFFKRSAQQVIRIADRAPKVRAERRGHRLRASAYTKGVGRWQVSYFERKVERAQVQVDDRTGAILEAWTGPQVAWSMARGYEGAFGRKLNAPYVWIPLCVLFLAPFVDLRRPFRVLHLDLLVLLAFGVSHFYFNRGDIDTSVPLVYPVLLYLLVRMLWTGFRRTEGRGRLLPHVPAVWLAVALIFLLGFRIGLNVVDSNVIDVGYAGVIGADRIVDGDGLYGKGFSDDVERGDTYGPVAYLLYVPFEQAMPWSGRWDDLPAAHGAAILFDLLVVGGLVLLGRRMRPGAEGRTLGVALAFAWAAYPYSSFTLQTNSNDALVAAAVVWALVALTLDPARARLSAGLRGALLALGAAAKFAPAALAPLFATAGTERRWRGAALFVLVFAAVTAAAFLPFASDEGVRGLYDRTVGYQAGRPAPFSFWGQTPSLDWLQTVVKAAAVALAVGVALVPRRKSAVSVAALAAAVLIAVQLSVTYWFYLYVAWFAPLVLVALLGRLREPAEEAEPPDSERRPQRALARA